MRKTVHEIKKRENAIIRINQIDVAGYQYIEVRQYYQAENGDFAPSTKGVTFPATLAHDIIAGLESAALGCGVVKPDEKKP